MRLFSRILASIAVVLASGVNAPDVWIANGDISGSSPSSRIASGASDGMQIPGESFRDPSARMRQTERSAASAPFTLGTGAPASFVLRVAGIVGSTRAVDRDSLAGTASRGRAPPSSSAR